MSTSVIYKYMLSPLDEQSIEMQVDAEVLSVQVKNGDLCIWSRQLWAGAQLGKAPRRFTIVGTGNEFDLERAGAYVGTVQMPPFVWHVFESRYA